MIYKFFVDSRSRSKTHYPNPSRYRVTLVKPLSNIKSIRLGSCCVPLIKGQPVITEIRNFAVCTDLHISGTCQPAEMGVAQFPYGTIGHIFIDDYNPNYIVYNNEEMSGSVWEATVPSGIPRLQSFELSLQYFDFTNGVVAYYPLPDFVLGGPNPEWTAVLAIDAD